MKRVIPAELFLVTRATNIYHKDAEDSDDNFICVLSVSINPEAAGCLKQHGAIFFCRMEQLSIEKKSC